MVLLTLLPKGLVGSNPGRGAIYLVELKPMEETMKTEEFKALVKMSTRALRVLDTKDATPGVKHITAERLREALQNVLWVDQQNEKELTSAEKDTLIALVESGPLFDGDVPSKQGRDSLIQRGFAVKLVVNGEDGYQAATYAGRDAYKALYQGPDGPADTIKEAKANRTAHRTIARASKT